MLKCFRKLKSSRKLSKVNCRSRRRRRRRRMLKCLRKFKSSRKFSKVNCQSRRRRRRRSLLQIQSTSESAGDYRRFFPFLLFWKYFTLNFICAGQIDYPTCLDYFVLDYYDITYNESTYSRSFNNSSLTTQRTCTFSFQNAWSSLRSSAAD